MFWDREAKILKRMQGITRTTVTIKMQENPIIIIGGGVAGCGTGALLASNGKKVIILEKNSFWGGRAGTRTPDEWGWSDEKFPEYHADFGHHVLGAAGFFEKLVDETGARKKIDLHPLPMALFYRDGKPHKAPRNLIEGLLAYRYAGIIEKLKMMKVQKFCMNIPASEAIRKYGYVPLGDFIEHFNLGELSNEILVEGFAGGYQTTVDLQKNSAADFILCVKLFFKGLKKYKKSAMLYPQGGFGRVIEAMAEVVKDHSGEAHLNAKVEKILTEKDGDDFRVSGVQVQGKDIKSDTVVSNVPVFQLQQLFDEEVVSRYKNFFERANEGNKETTELFGVICGSRKPLIGKAVNTWIFIPRSQLKNFKEYFLISELDSSQGVAPEGRQIITVATLMPNPPENPKEIGDKMCEDMKRIFGFDKNNCDWIKYVYFPVVDGIGRTVDWYADKRLGPETPVKGFYICGDSTKEFSTGTDGCANSSFFVAEKILGKKLVDMDEVFG